MILFFYYILLSFAQQSLAVISQANRMVKNSDNIPQKNSGSFNNSLFYQLDGDKLTITGSVISNSNTCNKGVYNAYIPIIYFIHMILCFLCLFLFILRVMTL